MTNTNTGIKTEADKQADVAAKAAKAANKTIVNRFRATSRAVENKLADFEVSFADLSVSAAWKGEVDASTGKPFRTIGLFVADVWSTMPRMQRAISRPVMAQMLKAGMSVREVQKATGESRGTVGNVSAELTGTAAQREARPNDGTVVSDAAKASKAAKAAIAAVGKLGGESGLDLALLSLDELSTLGAAIRTLKTAVDAQLPLTKAMAATAAKDAADAIAKDAATNPGGRARRQAAKKEAAA